MALKKWTTSKKVATDASKEMKNPKKTIRSIAASDLVQVDKRKQTSKEVATKASKTLSRKITTKKEKELAGSALSQASRKTKPKGK